MRFGFRFDAIEGDVALDFTDGQVSRTRVAECHLGGSIALGTDVGGVEGHLGCFQFHSILSEVYDMNLDVGDFETVTLRSRAVAIVIPGPLVVVVAGNTGQIVAPRFIVLKRGRTGILSTAVSVHGS